MEIKPRLLILQPIFSDYRKAFFDLLSQDYELKVLHSTNKTGVKMIKTDYSHEVKSIKYAKGETNRFFLLFKEIIQFKPDIFIHYLSVGVISLPFVWILCKILGVKFVVWGHGINRFETKEFFKSKEARLRKIYMQLSDAVILYGTKAFLEIKDHLPNKHLFIARNTIDTLGNSIIYNNLKSEGRNKVKNRLGITHKYNLIFIGRLLESKHPDYLISLLDKIGHILSDDVAVHFVGNGPMENRLKNKALKSEWKDSIIFHGAVHDGQKSGELLYVSDLMIMPGYLGLSVNHSLSFSTPVVSFETGLNGPFHSPEVENVINNETGYLAKNDDFDDLSQWVLNYLKSEDKMNYMQEKAREHINGEASLNQMKKGFDDCIKYLRQK